jgi:methionine aminopeptidase
MTNTRERLPKNAAKVEFIRNSEDIKSMLKAGYNLRNIYAKLVEIHSLAMSYYTLCAYSRKFIKNKEQQDQSVPQQQSIPKVPLVTPSSAKVTRPEDIDHRALF